MRLIDADELKTRVPNTSADIFENCRNCNLLDDWQVKELIDNAPTVEPASPWHRVELEEPTKAGWYLVMDVDGDFNVDEWHNTFGWQFVTPSDADRITYWMPIEWMPIEPPKEEEQ